MWLVYYHYEPRRAEKLGAEMTLAGVGCAGGKYCHTFMALFQFDFDFDDVKAKSSRTWTPIGATIINAALFRVGWPNSSIAFFIFANSANYLTINIEVDSHGKLICGFDFLFYFTNLLKFPCNEFCT